jgi:hypothetical protein
LRVVDRSTPATLDKIRKLSGLLPIFASCEKIRDDKGYWKEVEDYSTQYSEASFSHSVCPGCLRKFYPELYAAKEGGDGEWESLGQDIAEIDVLLENT